MEHRKVTSTGMAKLEQPMTVMFVRHAEAVSQAPEGTPKQDDPPLTPLGRRQALRLARRLEHEEIDHAYLSPAVRAHDTGQVIMKFHKHTPVTVVKDLDEISRDHFIVVPSAFSPSAREVLKREKDAVERFAHRLRHTHKPGEKILVVAHGNLIRTLMPVLGDRSPLKSLLMEVSNASVSVLEVWRSGSAVLKLANCVKHLLPGEVT